MLNSLQGFGSLEKLSYLCSVKQIKAKRTMAKTDLVKITCYGKTETMTRSKAKSFYLDCMMNSEGSERDRYVSIYTQLMRGCTECYDY